VGKHALSDRDREHTSTPVSFKPAATFANLQVYYTNLNNASVVLSAAARSSDVIANFDRPPPGSNSEERVASSFHRHCSSRG
jgi:hypothetical protein